VRQVEMELAGGYVPEDSDTFFAHFNWEQLSDEEFHLCPPVVAMGGDGAMFDIGFQNLSRALMSGKPIKVFIVDTQVYSNTGGQACTSGFIGQVADMSPYGAEPARQEREPQRDQPHRYGASHCVHLAKLSFQHHSHVGRIHRPASTAAALPCSTSTQCARRSMAWVTKQRRGTEQDGGGVRAPFPAVPLRSRCGRHLLASAPRWEGNPFAGQ